MDAEVMSEEEEAVTPDLPNWSSETRAWVRLLLGSAWLLGRWLSMDGSPLPTTGSVAGLGEQKVVYGCERAERSSMAVNALTLFSGPCGPSKKEHL